MNMNEIFLGIKDDETNMAYTVCTMRIYEFIGFNRFFTVKHTMGVIPSAHTYLGKSQWSVLGATYPGAPCC